MSKTVRGSKGCGYDYWSKRPYSGNGHGKQIKKLTHRAERVIKKEETQEAIEEMVEEEHNASLMCIPQACKESML